jgi:hypothetical protein
MDQKSIVLYLNRKSGMTQVIHDDLVATLGEAAIAYSTVTKYLREAQTGRDDAMSSSDEISHHIDDSDEAILKALEELPFSSVRQLSRATHIPAITVYRRFSEKLGFTARHLRWVLISSLRLRRQYASNVHTPFLRYCETTDQSLARHRDTG